jgi:hypothetical protein
MIPFSVALFNECVRSASGADASHLSETAVALALVCLYSEGFGPFIGPRRERHVTIIVPALPVRASSAISKELVVN